MGEKIFIELEPNLSSCIQTLAQREYKQALNTLLKTGTEDAGLLERLEMLRLFLESTDFGALRTGMKNISKKAKRLNL